jgi:mannose-6-phosphate isomerase-like protein (cupin superfamily)
VCAVKDTRHRYDVERRAYYAERPGFRIAEMQIGPAQSVPWHYHNEVQDTFYVIAGRIRIRTREPDEEVQLGPGQTYTVPPARPHEVTNAGTTSAIFLVLQGMGEFDSVSLMAEPLPHD